MMKPENLPGSYRAVKKELNGQFSDDMIRITPLDSSRRGLAGPRSGLLIIPKRERESFT
jgi:hypothetical protein